MTPYDLRIELLSDAAFGSGEGLAGLVDSEVEHDSFGLPFLHGRGVKGLLAAQCAEILYALGQQPVAKRAVYEHAANVLFGIPGGAASGNAILQFGPAQLPDTIRQAILAADVKPQRDEVLTALTTIRRQTAIDEATGAAKKNALRATRVLLRGLQFTSLLTTRQPLDETQQGLLAACVYAVRRAGGHRSRGLGEVKLRLYDVQNADLTSTWFSLFEKAVRA